MAARHRAASLAACTALVSGVKPGTSGSAVLRGDGVSFSQSDLPQPAPNQSPAVRAATLAVGILCG
ncbi:hypothetical protein [Pigmentiphaga kullae]|uniref:hypothetical protein n=1 Tax=Pigmentiphaga kullae TaxID=151784 RepID=UPI00102AF2AC|nr:hypothetical protein [Pigmentiphaga kullae]